jgi:hypothetical protein
MKTQTIISAFVLILLTSIFFSCQNSDNFIVGKWEIEQIGTSNSEDMLPLTVLSMVSVGRTFEFTEQGVFKTETTNGEYSFSSERKTVTLKDLESEHAFEVNKISENKIELKSSSNSLVITLIKK